jgi:DNA mismatch repair protein MutL
MAQFKESAISVNSLIRPYVFETSERDEEIINENGTFLENIGFKIERIGKREFALVTIPTIFGRPNPAEIIRDILDELSTYSTKEYNTEELFNKIAVRACRSAVKGGDILSFADMKNIMNELGTCKNPYTCPHGRPTLIRMSWGDLEKKFKRKE